eukprot:s909_g5.t1
MKEQKEILERKAHYGADDLPIRKVCLRVQRAVIDIDVVSNAELTEAEIKQREVRKRRWKDFLDVKNFVPVPLKSRHNDQQRLWGPAADMATTSLRYYVQRDEASKFFRLTVVKVLPVNQPCTGRARWCTPGEDGSGDGPEDQPQINDDDLDDQDGPGDQAQQQPGQEPQPVQDQQGPQQLQQDGVQDQPEDEQHGQVPGDAQLPGQGPQGIFDDRVKPPQGPPKRIDITKKLGGRSGAPIASVNKRGGGADGHTHPCRSSRRR